MDSKYKKELFLGFAIFILFIVAVSLIYLFQQNINKLSVKNYDTYLKSLPSDRESDLKKALYSRISRFESFNKFKDDIVIRDKSYTETYNKTEQTYSSVFIIDVASMEQSYKINLVWSKNSNTIIQGDDLVFSCLLKNDLIYKDFDCQKALGLQESVSDEIVQYLPQSGPHYIITIHSETGDKLELDANIFLDLSEKENNQTEISANKYKVDIANWFISKNLNINNYSINYIIN